MELEWRGASVLAKEMRSWCNMIWLRLKLKLSRSSQ
jgi:hypothetical protein